MELCQSSAGVGKTLSKTQSQLRALSGRGCPIAGATGATIKEATSTEAKTAVTNESPTADPYSLKFIQHAAESLQPVHKCHMAQYPHKEQQQKEGFALKKGGIMNTKSHLVFELNQRMPWKQCNSMLLNPSMRAR